MVVVLERMGVTGDRVGYRSCFCMSWFLRIVGELRSRRSSGWFREEFLFRPRVQGMALSCPNTSTAEPATCVGELDYVACNRRLLLIGFEGNEGMRT